MCVIINRKERCYIENIEDREYCVYEHIRLDNDTCFYVGKGRKKRAYNTKRNEHHDRVVNKVGMRVNILYDNLSEDEAYKLEHETIMDYVFNKGYGIDIIGYNNRSDEPGHLTNHTFGGDGSVGMVHSKEWCAQHSEMMKGKNNPAYGINYWETKTPEEVTELKRKYSIVASGENNPMFGVSPQERMSTEKYQEWLIKTKNRLSNQIGKANPNAKQVHIYDKDKNYLLTTDTIMEACSWVKEQRHLSTKISSMITCVSRAAKLGKAYHTYYFKMNN
jgi:hypothetical protein